VPKLEHVILEPLTSKDLPIFFQWINDREQVLLNAPYKPIGELAHRSWFENVQTRNDIFIFGIHLAETDKLIGSCQLHSINYIHRCAELQIRIGDPAERNKNYGYEAVTLLLDFAFKDLNLQRVYLHVFASNSAAIRLFEKMGLKREGLLRKSAYINGTYVDVLLMAILREEHKR